MIYLYDSLVAFVVKFLTNFMSLAVYAIRRSEREEKEQKNWSRNLLRQIFQTLERHCNISSQLAD